MKIEGPSRATASGPAKKKGGVAGTGGFSDLVTGGTDAAAPAGAAHNIASIDALLAAQAAEDPTARAARQRMKERAGSLLDQLEGIRAGLLTGTLTVGHVIGIADVVASHREKVVDPRLHALLDEIDLRARIEIAKMARALDKRG